MAKKKSKKEEVKEEIEEETPKRANIFGDPVFEEY